MYANGGWGAGGAPFYGGGFGCTVDGFECATLGFAGVGRLGENGFAYCPQCGNPWQPSEVGANNDVFEWLASGQPEAGVECTFPVFVTGRLSSGRCIVPRRFEALHCRPVPRLNSVHAGRRHSFLLKQARFLRYRGLREATIAAALRDICLQWCEDGQNYLVQNERKIMEIAEVISKMPVPKARSYSAARSKSDFELQLAFMVPAGVLVNKQQVLSQLRKWGFYYPVEAKDRKMLSRARKTLGIRSSPKWYFRGTEEEFLKALMTSTSIPSLTSSPVPGHTSTPSELVTYM